MQLSCPQTIQRFKRPRKFKPALQPYAVRLIKEPQFAKTYGNVTGSKRRGLIYENRVVEALRVSGEGIAGLWFEFADVNGHRYAQADWVGFDYEKGKICIVEIKLNRVPEAWWQLNRLYRPLVEKVFPYWDIALVEIASNMYSVAVPEQVKIIHDLSKAEIGKTSFMRIPYEGST